jgi:nucleoside 2-deoxyribosyltransferase
MIKKIRVYFAAPLFTQAEWQWNSRLAEELRQLNLEVMLPQTTAEPMLKGIVEFDAQALFLENIAQIDEADIVLAILDQTDPYSGTCWEFGYAYKAGRPVVGLRTDLRRGGDDPATSVNLMLSRSCIALLEVPFGERDNLLWVAQNVSDLIHRLMTAGPEIRQSEVGSPPVHSDPAVPPV